MKDGATNANECKKGQKGFQGQKQSLTMKITSWNVCGLGGVKK